MPDVKDPRAIPWSEAARALGLRLAIHPSYQWLDGRLGKHEVRVWGRLESTTPQGFGSDYVNYVLTMHRKPPVAYRIRDESGFTRLTRALGFPDIELGDPAFDAQVYVKGRDTEAIRAFLTPPIRDAILGLVQASHSLLLYDRQFFVTQADPLLRGGQIVETLEHMVAVADRLLQEGDDPRDTIQDAKARAERDAEASAEIADAKEIAAREARREQVRADFDERDAREALPDPEQLLLVAGKLPDWMIEQGVHLVAEDDEPQSQDSKPEGPPPVVGFGPKEPA